MSIWIKILLLEKDMKMLSMLKMEKNLPKHQDLLKNKMTQKTLKLPKHPLLKMRLEALMTYLTLNSKLT